MRKIMAHPVFDSKQKNVTAIRILCMGGEKIDLITHSRGVFTGKIHTVAETIDRRDRDVLNDFITEHINSRAAFKKSGKTWQELLNMLHSWYAESDRDIVIL